ncbi:MAG: HD domain-containing protein [Anaerolineae bacterium]|nr:HD domain-containing protein [Anaerolineae bacterium]
MSFSWEHPQLTGDLPADVTRFLSDHGRLATVEHSRDVAATAGRLALRFGTGKHVAASRQAAAIAGWLHDISAVIPTAARVATAWCWGVELLPEEAGEPVIVHQKLSAWMAEHSFGVTDAQVLSAIRCHTTLRRDAGVLDKIVFLADKIAWDQPGRPTYLAALAEALAEPAYAVASLDAGVCVYLDYLWQQRESLAVVHPWFGAAYRQLCEGRVGSK